MDGRTTGMGYTITPDVTDPKFTGEYRDPETTLDWLAVRAMSGAQGRFQSVDPDNAGALAGDPQTWNAYAYVGNNPLSYIDPSGLGFWSDLGNFFLNLGLNFITGGGWTVGNILANIGSCGGPLGNCTTLNSEPWSENAGLTNVQDPGRFVMNYSPDGHWDASFNSAIAAGYSLLDALQVAWGVVKVDRGTQGTDPAVTQIHAMGGQIRPGIYQSCAEAYSNSSAALGQDLYLAKGGDRDALYRAVHRVQDSYARGHGYRPWNGNLTLNHVNGDSESPSVFARRATTELLGDILGGVNIKSPEHYLFRPTRCQLGN